MASNGAAPASGGPALHSTLMEAEVACAVAHLKKARAHGAAAGQSLDHTALDFLDAHEGTALVAAGMGDKIISYTPRYNAFFPTTGSDYGQKNLATDGEGIDVFDVLKAESEFGVDAVDYVHLMMYDIHSAEGFHDAPPEGFFSRDHYDAVVRSHLDYGIPAEKIVMGFEPGPQAYTGVWGGMAYDIMTITDMKDTWGIGGVMFWEVTADRNDTLLDVIVENLESVTP